MRCTIDSPKAQFPEDLDIIHNIELLLNSATYPDHHQAVAVHEYGREALVAVLEYFGNECTTSDGTLKEPLINSENACWEFSQLKMTLKGHGRMNFKTTCGKIMRVYKEFFSEFAKLGLCIPVTSMPAEHGFSLQNRIKTARVRLMLLSVSSEANFLDHLSLAHAANIFNSMQQRQK